MWETPQHVLGHIGPQVDLLFLALEGAAADASEHCSMSGIDRRRFPNTFSDLVRTFAWIRYLDGHVAEGSLRGWTDGNAGIVLLTDDRLIRVLHEDDGGLPPPKTDERRRYYRQPQPTLLDALEEELSGKPSPWRVRHLVALWEFDPVDGLRLRLVAPRTPKEMLWEWPIPHPLADLGVDYDQVVDLDARADDVGEVELYDDPAIADDEPAGGASEVERIDEPGEEGGDAHAGGDV